MDKSLLDAFRSTTYLVCLNAIEWAGIAIDKPLPASLQALVGERSWAVVTAWNPRAQPRNPADNLAAQRQLHDSLRASSPGVVIHPALGLGRDGWHEPSLFVLGAGTDLLDRCARQHQQLAYVYGQAHESARLRLLD